VNSDKKMIYLLCSPGLGVLDQWLPVLHKLKEGNSSIEISLIISGPSAILTIEKATTVVKISKLIVDNIIFQTYSLHWLKFNSIEDAHCKFKSSFISQLILKCIRMMRGGRRLSRIKPLVVFADILNYFFLKVQTIRVKYFYKKNIFHISDINKNASALLYDITCENKQANDIIMKYMNGVMKYSIFHSSDTYIYGVNFNNDESKINPQTTRKDVVVFMTSSKETRSYIEGHSVSRENLIDCGIPKHDSFWVDYVNNFEDNIEISEGYIFLIGRPSSDYLPKHRKKKYLEDIKEISKKLNKKILIKIHPKERKGNLGDGLYESVFGLKNYGVNWEYTDLHAYILGRNCCFAISFYSGVSLDMTAIGVPVIEYLNLKDIPKYDNKNSLRDSDGNPVFSFRYLGVVLGVNNRPELDKSVSSILLDRSLIVKQLLNKYKAAITYSNKSSELIARTIKSNVGLISKK
jgi:hypothetical protein